MAKKIAKGPKIAKSAPKDAKEKKLSPKWPSSICGHLWLNFGALDSPQTPWSETSISGHWTGGGERYAYALQKNAFYVEGAHSLCMFNSSMCSLLFQGQLLPPGNCTVTFAGLTATFETDVGPTDLVVLTAFLTIRTVVVTFARTTPGGHPSPLCASVSGSLRRS